MFNMKVNSEHHVLPLTDAGEDIIDNVTGLRASHHREMNVWVRAQQLAALLTEEPIWAPQKVVRCAGPCCTRAPLSPGASTLFRLLRCKLRFRDGSFATDRGRRKSLHVRSSPKATQSQSLGIRREVARLPRATATVSL
jgi:hypothetical protein